MYIQLCQALQNHEGEYDQNEKVFVVQFRKEKSKQRMQDLKQQQEEDVIIRPLSILEISRSDFYCSTILGGNDVL